MIVMDTADTETGREDRIPVDLNQPIELSVHIPVGDVTVRATQRTDLLISHDTPDTLGDLGDDESELMIEVRNNRIEVRANSRAGTGWAGIAGDVDLDAVVGQITRAFRRGGHWSAAKAGKARVALGRHAWSDITIEVPQAISGRVQVHSASGDVRIEGVTGEIALNSMSGDVRAFRTSGDLALQTASGDLVVEGTTGRLTAQTASGDVHVTSAQIEDCHLQTANGDILLDALVNGAGPFHAQTASGDVRLTLRHTAGGEDPAVILAYHTVSGDAHVTQPFRKTGRRLWQAGSGDSGPRIDVTTVSGDLTAGFAITENSFVRASTPTAGAADPTSSAIVTNRTGSAHRERARPRARPRGDQCPIRSGSADGAGRRHSPRGSRSRRAGRDRRRGSAATTRGSGFQSGRVGADDPLRRRSLPTLPISSRRPWRRSSCTVVFGSSPPSSASETRTWPTNVRSARRSIQPMMGRRAR